MAKKVVLRRRYRVWFHQVNQTYVDVTAASVEEAERRARRKWRKEEGHPCVADVKALGDEGYYATEKGNE